MSHRAVLMAMVLAVLPSLAQALTVPALPQGMCALDESVPEQAAAITYMRSANAESNQLLASFASCAELAALKEKKANALRHYGAVLQQNVGQDMSMDRKAYVAAAATVYANEGTLLTETALTGVREALEASAKDHDLSSPQAVTAQADGILFRDETMLILGITQKNQFGQKTTEVASAAALTLIGGAPVSVNLYAPAHEKDAVSRAKTTLQPFVTRLIAANP